MTAQASCTSGNIRWGLTPHFQSNQEGGHLYWTSLALHHLIETSSHLICRQNVVFGNLFGQFIQNIRHVLDPGIFDPAATAGLPTSPA